MDFLDWPFFDERHRALRPRVRTWIQKLPEIDDADDRQACRGLVKHLAEGGFLDYAVPKPGDAIDVRSLCLIRETLRLTAAHRRDPELPRLDVGSLVTLIDDVRAVRRQRRCDEAGRFGWEIMCGYERLVGLPLLTEPDLGRVIWRRDVDERRRCSVRRPCRQLLPAATRDHVRHVSRVQIERHDVEVPLGVGVDERVAGG